MTSRTIEIRPSTFVLELAGLVCLVFLLSANLPAVVAFFFLGYFFTYLQRPLLGFVTLTLALLLFRGELGFLGVVKTGGLQFLGLSYCYLRAVHCLQEPPTSLFKFSRYYFFPATFVSGPVVPQADLQSAAPEWKKGFSRLLEGFLCFASSFILKPFLLLDSPESALQLHHQSVMLGWLQCFFAGLWLYLNFSGATSLFIGYAHLLGITLSENFHSPFLATNITDFWRSWHITLGNWLRAFVYTPTARLLLNAPGRTLPSLAPILAPLVTMVGCGLWHQFSASFLVWGLLHGSALSIHYLWSTHVAPTHTQNVLGKVARVASWVLTQSFVALSWLFFFPLSTSFGVASRLSLLLKLMGV